MNKDNLKKIAKLVGKLITIASIIFIVKVAVSFDINFTLINNIPLFVLIFVVGIFVMCGTVYIIAYGWKLILSVLSGKKVSFKDSAKIYAKANMGKYLPGNVMHYVERNLFAGSIGLDQKSVLLSTITEIFGLVSVCIIVGIIFEGKRIIDILTMVVKPKYLVIVIVAVVVVLIAVFVLRKKISKVISQINWKHFIQSFIKAIPMYFMFVLLGGCVMVAVFSTLMPDEISITMFYKVVVAYTTAWVIGFVVPGSPGGIGVREFVLLFLLKEYFPENIILTGILLHRLISVLGDAAAYLLSLVMYKEKINDSLS